MSQASLGEFLRFLQRACALQGSCDLPDHELLERYISNRDEGAFTFLVRRHGPMILSVGRGVLGDSHEAEDIVQATFLVLVRRRKSIGGKRSVGGWLHGVAQNIALKTKAKMAARRHWEREAGNMRVHESVDDLTLKEMRSVLDEEISSLPEKYRTPVVLCYLEGRSLDKAAGELGCPKTSLTRLLTKARELLRAKLERRGITFTAGVLAASLAKMADAAPLPASLTIQTVKAATLVATGKALAGGCISGHVLALVEEAMRGMFWIKAKMILMVVGLGLATTGVALSERPTQDTAVARPTQVIVAAAAPLAGQQKKTGLDVNAAQPAAQGKESEKMVRLFASGKVRDEKGKPIAAAKVYLREIAALRDEAAMQKPDYTDILATTTTDADGKFVFKEIATEPMKISPSNIYQYPWDLVVTAEGRGAAWHKFRTRNEENLTIVMGPEAKIHGQLLDDKGKPAAAVRMHVNIFWLPYTRVPDNYVVSQSRLNLYLSRIPIATFTGADGKFEFLGLPNGMSIELQTNDKRFARKYLQCATVDKMEIDRLNAQPPVPEENRILADGFTATLEPNGSIGGRVTYADTGKPAVGARVTYGVFATLTDNDGRYSFQGVDSRKWDVRVSPPDGAGYLAGSAGVSFTPSKVHRIQDFVLEHGSVIIGELRDKETGERLRVPYVQIFYEPEGDKLNSAKARTKIDGSFRIVVPPGKGKLSSLDWVPCSIPQDYASWVKPSIQIEIKLGETQTGKNLVFISGLVVKGRVLEANGKPVANADFLGATNQPSSDADGFFTLARLSREHRSHFLVLQAGRGLGAKMIFDPGKNPTPAALEVKLYPTQTLNARVVNENKKPVAGAHVSLGANIMYYDMDGHFSNFSKDLDSGVSTDKAGKYLIPNLVVEGTYTVRAWAPGYASATCGFNVEAGKDPEIADLVLKANKFAVGGVVIDATGKPIKGVQVTLIARNPAVADNNSSMETKNDGKFHFHSLTKGDYGLIVNLWKITGELDEDGRLVSKREAGTEQRVQAGEENLNIILDVPQEKKKEK